MKKRIEFFLVGLLILVALVSVVIIIGCVVFVNPSNCISSVCGILINSIFLHMNFRTLKLAMK